MHSIAHLAVRAYVRTRTCVTHSGGDETSGVALPATIEAESRPTSPDDVELAGSNDSRFT